MKTIILTSMLAALSFSTYAQSTEKILGVTTDGTGITYQVQTGGCTSKSDFTVMQLESLPLKLKLIRNKEDYCEMYAPYGTTIKFTWDELGLRDGTEAIIANPLARIRVTKF